MTDYGNQHEEIVLGEIIGEEVQLEEIIEENVYKALEVKKEPSSNLEEGIF
ncbi:hypothetical protein [Listeria immobilis]|uniref:hypothetical protein n=1 Tax=Listeria immobilis TaxID=2713502 RepID=UPI0016285209|nr:hypothetical protein [Listeria immobilis]MBC1515950.1 hypothetical protein [Listeria immobilis]